MAAGCSWLTLRKWEHHTKLLRAHVAISGRVAERRPYLLPYRYIETHAGPGLYDPRDGRGRWAGKFDGMEGSPIRALRVLRESTIPWTVHLSDDDPTIIRRLARAIGDDPHAGAACRPCAEAVDWFIQSGIRLRLGLIFFDPNGMCHWPSIWRFGRHFPFIDILINVNCTVQKRMIHSTDPSHMPAQEWLMSPSQSLRYIGRKHHYVWAPPSNDDQQFALMFATGLADFPEFRRAGFHELDSDDGRRVARRLDLTVRERAALPGPQGFLVFRD